jgi:hypothetical protein
MELPVNYEELTTLERKEVREEYVKLQEGKCYYCGKALNWSPSEEVRNKEVNWNLFPPQFLKYPVHLQHNHDTGMTEGAVHSLCNAVMWQYEGR